MSRTFNADGVLLTKIYLSDISIENVKKYLQVSHTNTNGQFKDFVRKLGLFRD